MTHSADELIRRAMQEGAFDDLPGKGKPLRLDDNPHADPEWRMAYHILQSSGYSLPWIETRREIETATLAARHSLHRSWRWRQEQLASSQPAPFVETEWARACAAFRFQAQELNRRIHSLNLEVPSTRFQMRLIDPDRELELTASLPSDTLPGSDA